jgi:hypothetical protein
LTERKTHSINCPFCGAPHRGYIASDTTQAKCEYCGGVFAVKAETGLEMHRCSNHPDVTASGQCDDCGGYFCSQCLDYYKLKTRGESATLTLCSSCLQNRYRKRANKEIYGGLMFLIAGLFMALIILWFGILYLAIGIAIIIHGLSSRNKTGETSDFRRAGSEEEYYDEQPLRYD